MNPSPCIHAVTKRISERSSSSREAYIDRIKHMETHEISRSSLSCANLAHGFAVCSESDKIALSGDRVANLGIVTSYNDMLSAHHPFKDFPALIKEAAHKAGGVAQVAGGVPAMCDGITQGQKGMELSLFSRDIIAMSTAIGLSHNMFDAALYLGVCDKIVPGLLIAALSFGYLPAVFIPAGPMTSGIPNDEKSRIRQLFAEGKVDRKELLEAESKSYHGPGTCTFYGTANSNQMFMEIMGLHTPGSSFINPGTPLRNALTREAVECALSLTRFKKTHMPAGYMINEKSFVNAIVGLHATGGSTNHTIHLIAMAAAAGIHINWEDIEDIASVVPLLTRIYPNGKADVNHFNAAGGMGFVIRELLDAGYLHEDVQTVWGAGLRSYTVEAKINSHGHIERVPAPVTSPDENVLVPVRKSFQNTGGLKVLNGNIGQAIIKTASLKPERRVVEAPAIVLDSQEELENLFKRDELNQNFIAVIRFQGPKANGMPELHKLTTILAVLQDRGFTVGLLTDGRMSGASGKVPAAIHLTPEAVDEGGISKIQNGDIIRIDSNSGELELLIPSHEFHARPVAKKDLSKNDHGFGRELFTTMRHMISPANQGASFFRF